LLMRVIQSAAKVHATVRQECEVALVSGQAVISVDTVLDQEFPVSANTIRLGSVGNLHSCFRLIADYIEILSRSCHIVIQRGRGMIEANEDKAAVGIHSRRRAQSKFCAVKGAAIRILARDTDEIAPAVERPCVVRALKTTGVAVWLPAYQ